MNVSFSHAFAALRFGLIAVLVLICFSSCGLFRKDGDKLGKKHKSAESLGSYRLEAGSTMNLEIFEGGKSMQVAYVVVDESGDVIVPGIGEVSVIGMSPLDAAKKIEFMARSSGQNHLGGPRVHVKALDRRAVVHVIGLVNQPGPVTFGPGVTVWQAIEAAGGVTSEANQGSIGLTTEGRKTIVTTPKTREVKEGDLVNVPRRL